MGRTTNERPKCLTEAIGRPLLEWQIDALAYGGITEVAVVTGYQSAQLASSKYTTILQLKMGFYQYGPIPGDGFFLA